MIIIEKNNFNIDKYKESLFLWHVEISVQTSSFLREFRKSDITENDRILIQALIEIKDDINSFGPFTIKKRKNQHGDEFLTVFFDNNYVLIAEKKENTVILRYIRDNNSSGWMDEICLLAETHYNMLYQTRNR